VSSYEEHLWKISLQTNKYAKSYRVGVYLCQSAPDVFDWMTHVCVIPDPVHLNVWRIRASISTEGVSQFIQLALENDIICITPTMILSEDMKPIEHVPLHPICVGYFLTWCTQANTVSWCKVIQRCSGAGTRGNGVPTSS